jgi:hypothetical protein
MFKSLPLWLAFGFASLVGISACHDNAEVTSANLSLVRLMVDVPDVVKSGAEFGAQVRAMNVGLAGVHEGHVTVKLPAPLMILSISAPKGSSATFSNGISGGTVEWDLGSLDSNSQEKLDITTKGFLSPTEGTRRLTVVASMVADGIKPGDAAAQDDVTLVE